MRLIDADALLKAFSEDIDTDVCQTFADYLSEWGFSHDTVERAITDAPTIEAEPVRHGRWIHNTIDYPQSGWIKHKCSICEHWQVTNQPTCEHLMYCPNCGAKMDGDKYAN